MEQKYIIALEVGSSKIRGALGVTDGSGILTVKAVEEERLVDSVRHGCVRNVAEVADSVNSILRRLESREGGRSVTGVYVALGGRSMVSSAVPIERRLPSETEITGEHLRQIYDDARSKVLIDRDVVDVVPVEFFVDKNRVNNITGTFGSEIEATFNLISCRSQLRRNLSHALSKTLNLDVRGYVVRQLAEGDLVLTPEERRLGCVLVDFGAETTTVSVYKYGAMQYMATLPLGSRNITRDITSLAYLEEEAEKLKCNCGDAMGAHDASAFPGETREHLEINNLVGSRSGEIIANICEQIKASGLQPSDLPSGIVVIGGGARLNGFTRRLEDESRMRVRMGMPGGQSIRITDSRIQPAMAVDVISILAAVAPHAIDCMTRPEPVPTVDDTVTTVDDEPEPEPEPEPIFEEDHPRRDRGSIFGKLRDRFARLISENEEDLAKNEEDDDDDIMRDDDR